jgi:L-ribulose-5-phosphate 4-epimerase
MSDFSLKAARAEILEYCLLSMQYGLNFNTQGNISIRIPDQENRFLITPTDLEYDKMRADDIVVVDENATVVEGPHEPSSEVTVHLAFYKKRRDINAIVHSEPVYTNVWGVIGEPIRGPW